MREMRGMRGDERRAGRERRSATTRATCPGHDVRELHMWVPLEHRGRNQPQDFVEPRLGFDDQIPASFPPVIASIEREATNES